MNICISFEYTAIAFFLPSILAQFLGAGVFETISASLGLNALFAFTGGLLGMHLAWKYPSRHVAIAGFALQFVALIVLALVGNRTRRQVSCWLSRCWGCGCSPKGLARGRS